MSQQANSPLSTEPTLGPVRRERLDEQIVRILVDAVVDGRWPVGSTLPPERQLAAELAVNRTSLRQALARLEQIGLIVGHQGHGNVVQDPAALTAPEVVAALVGQLGPELFDEILEVRTGLGRMIGALAADRATDHEREALQRAGDAVEAAESPMAAQQAEMAYFVVLVNSTHNRVLGALVRWVDATYGQLPGEFAGAFTDLGQLRQDLNRITAAVAHQQPTEASDAVEAYFESSGIRLSSTLSPRR